VFQSGIAHKPEARAKDTAELPSLALFDVALLLVFEEVARKAAKEVASAVV
jgi:hypothetical protein